jgi:putative chitinase
MKKLLTIDKKIGKKLVNTFNMYHRVIFKKYPLSRTQRDFIITTLIAENGDTLIPQEENLRYSYKRFREIFGHKYRYSSNRITLGNNIYDYRLGNKRGEGFKYRGRGYVQLTGKSNYIWLTREFSKTLYIDISFVKYPNLLLRPSISFLSLLLYYRDNCIHCRTLECVTEKVNGSLKDIKRRKEIYDKVSRLN